MLMQLSINCRIRFCYAVGGDAFITCSATWLAQKLRLMNNRWHVQHYSNEAARVVQVLYGVLLSYFLAQSGKILAQFLCKSFALLYFILLQMGEPLNALKWCSTYIITGPTSKRLFFPIKYGLPLTDKSRRRLRAPRDVEVAWTSPPMTSPPPWRHFLWRHSSWQRKAWR